MDSHTPNHECRQPLWTHYQAGHMLEAACLIISLRNALDPTLEDLAFVPAEGSFRPCFVRHNQIGRVALPVHWPTIQIDPRLSRMLPLPMAHSSPPTWCGHLPVVKGGRVGAN